MIAACIPVFRVLVQGYMSRGSEPSGGSSQPQWYDSAAVASNVRNADLENLESMQKNQSETGSSSPGIWAGEKGWNGARNEAAALKA